MKKLSYAAVVACLLPLFSAHAQSLTTKGTRTLGVAATDQSYFSTTDYSTSLRISVAPSVGKFFADNWAVGLAVPLAYASTKTKQTGNRSRGLAVGVVPWLRYYLPSESRHRVFAQAQAGAILDASWGQRAVYDGFDSTIQPYRNTDFGYLAGLGAGYSYFLTPNVGVEALLLYHQGGFSNTGNLGVDIGLRAYLGN
ncbi:PorT family protein [Hymenobacter sp. HSC-4F20]|uniref:PorT family protein n=1 Tax=Hymenobacter sp. HSC-4F20 TaxID=2864135 RepID=UPI001C7375B8|nr:PorT family protein [Hymenobacter sp. HSC-4F20]MBX0292651.1 PorT family protein [Hymenobacter sp. HSC-4F20]